MGVVGGLGRGRGGGQGTGGRGVHSCMGRRQRYQEERQGRHKVQGRGTAPVQEGVRHKYRAWACARAPVGGRLHFLHLTLSAPHTFLRLTLFIAFLLPQEAEEERLRQEFAKQGIMVPKKARSEIHDSNTITPGRRRGGGMGGAAGCSGGGAGLTDV